MKPIDFLISLKPGHLFLAVYTAIMTDSLFRLIERINTGIVQEHLLQPYSIECSWQEIRNGLFLCRARIANHRSELCIYDLLKLLIDARGFCFESIGEHLFYSLVNSPI